MVLNKKETAISSTSFLLISFAVHNAFELNTSFSTLNNRGEFQVQLRAAVHGISRRFHTCTITLVLH